ncbi:MAG: hypothetical protein EP298_11995 [Gammaproteobacteria bacterium]|nr:MAG: hypothetical protein EP298_11995 [Gammaproteobacteria bacterium]UTW43017.1 hypothetical protein KFE69_02420 [bacterium SCSIO 12844]
MFKEPLFEVQDISSDEDERLDLSEVRSLSTKAFVQDYLNQEVPLSLKFNEKEQSATLYLVRPEGGVFAGGASNTVAIPKDGYFIYFKSQLERGVSGEAIASFSATVLPWKENSICTQNLDEAEDIIVTPILEGCTFVIDKKNAEVHHINAQTESGNISVDLMHTKIEKLMRENSLSESDIIVIGPQSGTESYHFKEHEKLANIANVVGVKTQAVWEFNVHTYGINCESEEYEIDQVSVKRYSIGDKAIARSPKTVFASEASEAKHKKSICETISESCVIL